MADMNRRLHDTEHDAIGIVVNGRPFVKCRDLMCGGSTWWHFCCCLMIALPDSEFLLVCLALWGRIARP